eukprot:scaffold14317_cov18-Tisochrysis_lutea.AAC.1
MVQGKCASAPEQATRAADQHQPLHVTPDLHGRHQARPLAPHACTALTAPPAASMQVAELILDANVPSVHEHKEYETHLRANITDSLNVLGKLAHGMDVNI